MSAIFVNGTEYANGGGGGGGGSLPSGGTAGQVLTKKSAIDGDVEWKTGDRVLTQAEYDALSSEEKNNGTTYFISDSDGNSSDYSYQYAFRGKNLGNTFTAEQKAAIAAGDFREFWNGDYWEDQSGRKWRIVDNSEPFIKVNAGNNTKFMKHHIIVMPDDNLVKADGSTHYMNDTDTSSGGYKSSKYRSTYKSICKNLFDSFFGSDFVAVHREIISDATSSGKASGWSWVDADVELPNEINMYGCGIWSNGGSDFTGYNVGLNKTQFKLFIIKPEYIFNSTDQTNASFWLRDVPGNSDFACVTAQGISDKYGASATTVGFRPYAIIVGD